MIPARQPVDYAAGGRFQKQADATGREYLVDKLTGAWTPVAELTTNAPVSPLRDGEDEAMYQRPSAHHPSATTSHKKRGRDEMGPFRTGKPADDDTSIVSSENSQKSLHDEVAQLRARLDAVERRTAADLLAMETVISHSGVVGVAGARRDALGPCQLCPPPRLKTQRGSECRPRWARSSRPKLSSCW